MQPPILSTQQLSHTYQTGDRSVPVIRQLELNIKTGDFTVIMGSSGSGKSTLLYLLSGLDEPTNGTIFFRQESLGAKSDRARTLLRRQQIGFVFQNSNLVPNLSLLENVLIAGYLSNKDRKTIRQRAEKLFEEFNLSEQLHRLPTQVSGGEQQRCAIIRAIINEPDVLFADEPTGSLNFQNSQHILNAFQRLHAAGQTIVMVTHDVKTACVGNRILYFRDGQVLDELHFHTQQTPPQREEQLTNWLMEKGW